MSFLRYNTAPVVAITGGARGIGLATAKAMYSAGARVAIGDIDGEASSAAAMGIGSDAAGAQLDVADEGSFREFLDHVAEQHGSVDVLVNNAGIMPIGPFLDESVETARRVLEINVLGCLIGMKAVLPPMLARGSGHVINVASAAGKSPVPGGLSYAASKAAVVSATETARVEFGGRGVSFTCVMPSFTNTDLIAGTKGTRLVKTVEPEDVAAAIVAAVADPRPDVYVPGSVGAILKVTPLLGRRVRDTINRCLTADRTFLEIDQEARAEYDRRIGRGPTPPALPGGDPAPNGRTGA